MRGGQGHLDLDSLLAPQLSSYVALGKPLTFLDPVFQPLKGGLGASLAREQQETLTECPAHGTCCTAQSSGLDGSLLHHGSHAGEEAHRGAVTLSMAVELASRWASGLQSHALHHVFHLPREGLQNKATGVDFPWQDSGRDGSP